MTSWVFFTEEADGSEAQSSPATFETAISYAHDHLIAGIRVVRLEASNGEIWDEHEIKAHCERSAGPAAGRFIYEA